MVDEPSGFNLPLPQLKSLKSNLFTGRLTFVGTASQKWDLYFYLGRLLYATGGHHAMRRWLRHIALYCPPQNKNPYQSDCLQNFTDVSHLSEFEISICWEYFLLRDGIQNHQLSRETVTILIQKILLEILFDIQQANAFIENIIPQEQLNPQIALFDIEQLWDRASLSWRQWKQNRLATVFPDRAAVISRSARLRQEMSPAAYIALETLMDGRRSLREISAQTGRSVLEVASSLLIYVEPGNILLVEVPDLIDPAERFFSTHSQSGNLIQPDSRNTIRNAPSPQDITQGASVAW